MGELRFDGRVAIVTGAGGNPGLGRSYAMLLASRGARVVVNDLGVSADDGRGGPRVHAADAVVGEIVAAGGEAVADMHSVAEEDGAKAIVQTALDTWGKVDIVVNNAGVFYTDRFDQLASADINRLVQVHLFGNIWMCRAAWPVMKEQGYGRIVNISSSGMLEGPFVIYGAAKAGIYGLTRGLASDGRDLGIKVNAFNPLAYTAGIDNLFDEWKIPGIERSTLDPDSMAPVVAYLAHEDCPVSGKFLSSAGGRISEYYMADTAGYYNPGATLEDVRDNFETLTSRDGSTAIPDPGTVSSAAVLTPKSH